MKKLLVLMIIILFATGCSHFSSSISLNNLSHMSYQKMHDRLTSRSDYDTGLFIEVRAYATLLVPEMRQYRSDIPTDGTAVEFNIEGTQEDFIISRMVLTVEDGAGDKFIVNGIGTPRQNIKSIKFIPLESVRNKTQVNLNQQQEGLIPESSLSVKTIDEPIAYNHFILVFPFKITDKTRYLHITCMDLLKPEYKAWFTWNFK